MRGAVDDAALKSRLEKRTRGIPVVITATAAIAALSALSVQRLALFSPPWFSPELDQQGARYFESQGFEVIYSGPVGLPPDQQAIQPVELYDWIRTRVPERAEAVFIGGNDPMYGPAVRCKWFRRAGGERSCINVSGL